MATHPEGFEIDPVIVPIEDGSDTSPVAVEAWLGSLEELESIELGEGVVADLVRELREHGER